jgi:hypothetical protein
MRALPPARAGDVGPDDVLVDGEVAAVFELPPSFQPVLFASETAVYWCHVLGHRHVDTDATNASFTARHRHRYRGS